MSGPSSDLLEALDREGFAVVPELADEETLASLSRAIEETGTGESARRRGASRGAYAMRNLRRRRRARMGHLGHGEDGDTRHRRNMRRTS